MLLLAAIVGGCSDGKSAPAPVRDIEVHAPAPRIPHVPPWLAYAHDLGPLDPSEPLTHLRLLFARTDAQQHDWDALLTAQQTPGSSDYHRWLTPEEIGLRFGATPAAIETVRAWLVAHRLRVDEVSRSRAWLTFRGTAGDIGAALSTELHRFDADGVARVSVVREPTFPEGIAGLVRLVGGLSTATPRPQSHVAEITWSNGAHYIGPADFATLYDVGPVYAAGTKGAGQTIAIVGRSRVAPTDISAFQTETNLPNVAPTVVIPPAGTDPGLSGNDDQLEATLDVTRAGSVAPGATIDLVVSVIATGSMEDGTNIAEQYVIDNKTASILSISFLNCEQEEGAAVTELYDTLFQQGAMEGISIFVSSGDSGAAGCDMHGDTPPSMQLTSANALCTSGSVTCVGGTEFADTADPGAYWRPAAGWAATALARPPEGAWNEPLSTSNSPVALASGGGVSVYIAKPAWQTGTGVPAGTFRVTPDIALSAADHDAYAMCYGGDCSSGGIAHVYGTSASAPSMAGIAALVNEVAGSPQGNLNPALYSLAQGAGGSAIFHDVTVATSGVTTCTSLPSMCNNSTAGTSGLDGGLAGYMVGPGYDPVTGWGSLDVAKLVETFGCTGAADGTPCNDANACTAGDTCKGGVCQAGIPVVCMADGCHTAGVCTPATGCSMPNVADGTACTGVDLCLAGYACTDGACVSSTPVMCAAEDECHVAGVCEPTTGICTNPNAPDNVPCAETNRCEPTDSCQNGICVGSDPVVCSRPSACQLPGACVPATGACVYPPKANDTACDGGMCVDGGCVVPGDGGAVGAGNELADGGGGASTGGGSGENGGGGGGDGGDASSTARPGGCSCRVGRLDHRAGPDVGLGAGALVFSGLVARRRRRPIRPS